jgi:hypothetical protein
MSIVIFKEAYASLLNFMTDQLIMNYRIQILKIQLNVIY